MNRGVYRFEPVSATVIRYGLGAIKGTGQQAVEAIVAARESGGLFTSLFDFCVRVERSKINKRTIEALIKAGAFDTLQQNRAAMLDSVDLAFDFAVAAEANANQGGLFDMMGGDEDAHGSSTQEPELNDTTPWGVKERLTFEKTAMGFYFSGHLFDEVSREIHQFVKRKIDDLIDSREPQLLAGIVSDFRVINGQRGKIGLFKLDDSSGQIETTVDDAMMQANRNLFKEDELIIVMGVIQADRFSGGSPRLKINQVWDLPTARCRFGKHLKVDIGDKTPDVSRPLREFPPMKVQTEQGELQRGMSVRVAVARTAALGVVNAEIQLGDDAKFYPSDAALASWMAQSGIAKSHIVYE